ncbi:proton-conducting transporter membrane subunit [Ihubacter sp. mB4P-1]|uniref:proton-conducting transporter transmembrane domain-containing protein n=1 Tax=Ihubacter sp. mB4P-1 TaxID=3242370 RepID=UPI00137B69D9
MHNLHPALILILSGLISFVIPRKSVRNWAALAGAIIAMAAMILLGGGGMEYGFTPSLTFELLAVDRLSKTFGLIFCVIGVIAAIYSMDTGSRGEKCAAQIYAGSSLGVVFAGDWISLICFWEVMAVASWYLVLAGGTHQARRASYRYLVMHFFGGNLLLAGVIWICSQGSFEVSLLTDSFSGGYWLILLGFAVNGAIPPLHTWVADAYPESTPSGTVYMGSYTTKVAVYALIRVFAGTEEFVLIGGIMAVLAACMALVENDLRRLLSYHIISQLGMMIAALGTGSHVGIDGAALHAAYNILYKGVLLMAAGAVITTTGKRKISELGGLAKKMPLTAVCFLFASLAIAGMPFLNGFASKALIMESLREYPIGYWLVMLAGVGTWLSITLKINYFVFFGKTSKEVICGKTPVHMQAAMAIGAILCILTGVLPNIGYSLTPFSSMVHLFSIDHILEYVGLFIGATVPFVMLLPMMAPHDMLSLDFDWAYRRLIPKALVWLSKLICRVFDCSQVFFDRTVLVCRHVALHPLRALSNVQDLKDMKENEDAGAFEGEMPVGIFMLTFLSFCIVAFLVIAILEQ